MRHAYGLMNSHHFMGVMAHGKLVILRGREGEKSGPGRPGPFLFAVQERVSLKDFLSLLFLERVRRFSISTATLKAIAK